MNQRLLSLFPLLLLTTACASSGWKRVERPKEIDAATLQFMDDSVRDRVQERRGEVNLAQDRVAAAEFEIEKASAIVEEAKELRSNAAKRFKTAKKTLGDAPNSVAVAAAEAEVFAAQVELAQADASLRWAERERDVHTRERELAQVEAELADAHVELSKAEALTDLQAVNTTDAELAPVELWRYQTAVRELGVEREVAQTRLEGAQREAAFAKTDFQTLVENS